MEDQTHPEDGDLIELHTVTGIDIPERDYPKLETLAGCMTYLRAKGIGG